jgi:hypothetical protein
MKKFNFQFSFKAIVLLTLFALIPGLSGCANRQYKKIFVYGFGTMQVPRDAGVAKIDELVTQQYGANLFWSPR